ncbi:hypothetical protein [Streptomyces sp. NBC_01217]|uniref:hypothetical protein n=1 Tax=Streptomyces sp. NBC_01217 TaxID=2903779 RepID=UPI002E101511|nr:FUSC family protein [Streptomyces sp. NBC_01217]
MTRRNRPNADRRAKAAGARRATVLNLLARLDRGELTRDERTLLRDAITADHAALDTARQAQREHGTAMRRQARQLDAAHDAIREAEQLAADYAEQLRAYRAVEEQRQAEHRQTLARLLSIRSYSNVRALADSTPQHTGRNAEDCRACRGTNPPYPFICPGESGTRTARIRAFLDEQTAHLTTTPPEPQP